MDVLSFDNLYAQLKFGFDLVSTHLTRPISLLVIVACLFIFWRLLTPQR